MEDNMNDMIISILLVLIGFFVGIVAVFIINYIRGTHASKKIEKMLEDAKKLVEAGVFAIVLEMVPSQSAKYVTENISVPTIGIGAGVDCSGQVLVIDDMLGRYSNFTPKFAKKYANLYETIRDAVKEYKSDVLNKNFPSENHCFNLSEDELTKLKNIM